MTEPTDDPGGDLLVDELARLARQNFSGDAPRRDEASFARVGLKVDQRRARRRTTMTLLAAAAVVLCLVGGGAVFWRRESAVTYTVVNGKLVDGDRIVGGSATRLRFSEGSEVTLEPGAETRILELDAHGGRLSLQDGTAQVSIAKRPGAAWTLAAGPYTVRVTGTAFSLCWTKREQALEIAMKSGSVVVTGPHAGSGMTVQAGERLRGSLTAGTLTLETPPSAVATAPAPASSAELAGGPSSTSASEVKEAEPGSGSSRADLGWAQKAAAGDFKGVVEAATARGIAPTVAGVSLSDLSALADSARYLRRTELARQALMAQRTRFPRSAAARDAAFFLGRIAEDQGDSRAAIEWYDRYFGDTAGGSYASQALGRKLMLVYRQAGAARARVVARDYLERFPAGPYAAAAKNIVREADH